MYILRSLYLLWLIPRSWIDAVLVRKKPFAQRYACMKKWSERLLSHYRVTLDVTDFVCMQSPERIRYAATDGCP